MSTYLPAGLAVPVPMPDGTDAPYREGLLRHELLVQRCAACGTWQWPPEVICHKCRTFHPGWEPVQPAGTVFSWTRIWHSVHPVLDPAVPYLGVIVELSAAGGIRMVGNLLGDPLQPVRVGLPVAGVFEDHAAAGGDAGAAGYTLLQWRSAARGRPDDAAGELR
jgi:uncharacterized OB-fold protein